MADELAEGPAEGAVQGAAGDHHAHHHDRPAHVVSRAVEELRRRGERDTAARRSVLQALAGHAEHLSADEVAEMLSSERIHRTTAYRTLERFAELGIVTVRQVPGEAASYHLAAASHLHAHCRICHAVMALDPESFEAAAETAAQSIGFQLDLQQSTLIGRCARCTA